MHVIHSKQLVKLLVPPGTQPFVLSGQGQHGMRSLPDTSIYDF